MLKDDIKETVKHLKELDVLENAVQDVEIKTRNDNDYTTLISNFTTSMLKLDKARKNLRYDVSDETLQYAEETIEKLNSVISSGAVDEDTLGYAKQHVNKKVNPNMLKEWKAFFREKTSGVLGKLATIARLVQDSENLSMIRTNIVNGNDWNGLSLADDGINTRLDLLISSIEEADEMEKGLNLSEEIKTFLVLVTIGKARVSDLNDTIIKWINKEKLEDKFVVNFKEMKLD